VSLPFSTSTSPELTTVSIPPPAKRALPSNTVMRVG
jgi:hypothetical protein